MKIIFVLIISYLFGSIPFSYIFTRYIKGEDIRNIGSGNIGATNATRALGLYYGLIIVGLDIFKGFFAVWLTQLIFNNSTSINIFFIAGLFAIIGHNYSIFLKFSGGKGVATTLGVLLRLLPGTFFIYVFIWIIIVLLSRYVSLASLISAISLPFSTYFYYNSNVYYAIFVFILAVFIIYRHHSNIKRLFKGNERRMKWPLKIERGDYNGE
jgi:acyl phosphate:glycerol-3-phosphate acyltransferase